MKTCKYKECNNPVWSKDRCKWHPTETTKKKQNYIKPISDKRMAQMKMYRQVRDEYMMSHPKCEVCNNDASDLHHKRGRVGDYYTDIKHFLSVCRSCHTKIEENPEWAKRFGYSENRL